MNNKYVAPIGENQMEYEHDKETEWVEQPDLDLSGESNMYPVDPLKFFEKLCGAYGEIANSLIPKEILDGMSSSKPKFESKYGCHISKYIQETRKGDENM